MAGGDGVAGELTLRVSPSCPIAHLLVNKVCWYQHGNSCSFASLQPVAVEHLKEGRECGVHVGQIRITASGPRVHPLPDGIDGTPLTVKLLQTQGVMIKALLTRSQRLYTRVFRNGPTSTLSAAVWCRGSEVGGRRRV
jgi:hypothetical protein